MSVLKRTFRTIQACLCARAGWARAAGELVTANALERVRQLATHVTEHAMKTGSLMYVPPALRKFPLALPGVAKKKWRIDLRDAETMLQETRRRIPCPEGVELRLNIVRPEQYGRHIREPYIAVNFRPHRASPLLLTTHRRDTIPDLSA